MSLIISIHFSVFSKEEEPKTWNNSYDISDHSIKNGTQEISAKYSNENDNSNQQSSLQLNGTKDLINASYPSCSSFHLERSVDVTLFESEKRPSEKTQKDKHAEIVSEKSRPQAESFDLDDTEGYIIKYAGAYIQKDNTQEIFKEVVKFKQAEKIQGDNTNILKDANKKNEVCLMLNI